MAGAPGIPIPNLNLSSGPAVAEGTSGGTTVNFGPFGLHSQPSGLIQQAMPWLAVGGAIWLLTRR